MKHTMLINKIVEAEHSAQEMADEAALKREKLPEEVLKAKEKIRNSYNARAGERLKLVKKAEEEAAEEAISELQRSYEKSLSELEATFKRHREEWVELLFSKIIQ